MKINEDLSGYKMTIYFLKSVKKISIGTGAIFPNINCHSFVFNKTIS